MIIRKSIYVTLFFGAIVAVGCNSGSGAYTPKPTKESKLEDIKPEDGAKMFPITVGNKWTYSVKSTQAVGDQTSKKEDELTFTITEVKPGDNGGQNVTIQTDVNGEPGEKQVWLVDSRGIFQVSTMSGKGVYSPAQPSMMFPLKDGPNFTWKGKGPTVMGVEGSQEFTGTMLKPQWVDTDMGRFTAICVEADGTFDAQNTKGQMRVTSYWAKGVGLVRYRQETAFVSKNVPVRGIQLISLKVYSVK